MGLRVWGGVCEGTGGIDVVERDEVSDLTEIGLVQGGICVSQCISIGLN